MARIVWMTLAAAMLLEAAMSSTFAEAPAYPSHHDLMFVVRADGTREPIRDVDAWRRRREHILLGMQQAMGPLPRPETPTPLDVQVVEEAEVDGLVRRKISYSTDRAGQRVRAWLLMPRGAARRPAVLCLHQTNVRGKDSPAGLSDRPTLHYALELARRGYVTLSPDYPSFGEYEYDFDADEYESGSMKAIYDNMRAVDVLRSMAAVDGERIGCIGHSLGGHNALFTAAFDERIKAVVTSCGFTRFDRYIGGDLTGWTSPRYMPRIATEFEKSPGKMPFDFPEVLAAIAPRAVFVVAPVGDDNFDVTGVRECVAAARSVFELYGKADRLRAVYPESGHDFPDAEREEAYAALDEALQ